MTGFGAKDEQKRVRGLVADRIECPPELTRALSAALGERLQYVVVSDLDTGVEAVRYLSEGRRGRATLIPTVPSGERGPMAEASTEPGVVGRLFDLVRVSDEDRALAEHLLGDVLVVEDLEHARALHDRGQGRSLLVTRDGQVLGADGSLAGGDGEDAGAHLLASSARSASCARGRQAQQAMAARRRTHATLTRSRSAKRRSSLRAAMPRARAKL